MESAELRKIAAQLREAVRHAETARFEKAAHVLAAAVAVYRLQQKVRSHV